MNVARELQELRGRLDQVEQWKARREKIEQELAEVWVEGGGELPSHACEDGEMKTESGQIESLES
jgi:ATP-binding cassette, subfamily D (ALD), peroxisomal long-chain fatty acid import protein